jgi:hypothetical protein
VIALRRQSWKSSNWEEIRGLNLAPARSMRATALGHLLAATVTRSASTIVAGVRCQRHTDVHAKAPLRRESSRGLDADDAVCLEMGTTRDALDVVELGDPRRCARRRQGGRPRPGARSARSRQRELLHQLRRIEIRSGQIARRPHCHRPRPPGSPRPHRPRTRSRRRLRRPARLYQRSERPRLSRRRKVLAHGPADTAGPRVPIASRSVTVGE